MLRGIGENNYGGRTMVGGSRGAAFAFGRIEVVTWLWIVSAIATIAVSELHQSRFYTHGRYGKRDESAYAPSMPFFSGSRYGRSGAAGSRGPKSAPKLLEVSPRIDRFFPGSRYGKRVPGVLGNDSENFPLREAEPPARISSLRRFEEALGYLDRAQRAENSARTSDDNRAAPSSKSNGNDKGNDEEIPIDIPNDDELDGQ